MKSYLKLVKLELNIQSLVRNLMKGVRRISTVRVGSSFNKGMEKGTVCYLDIVRKQSVI